MYLFSEASLHHSCPYRTEKREAMFQLRHMPVEVLGEGGGEKTNVLNFSIDFFSLRAQLSLKHHKNKLKCKN